MVQKVVARVQQAPLDLFYLRTIFKNFVGSICRALAWICRRAVHVPGQMMSMAEAAENHHILYRLQNIMSSIRGSSKIYEETHVSPGIAALTYMQLIFIHYYYV